LAHFTPYMCESSLCVLLDLFDVPRSLVFPIRLARFGIGSGPRVTRVCKRTFLGGALSLYPCSSYPFSDTFRLPFLKAELLPSRPSHPLCILPSPYLECLADLSFSSLSLVAVRFSSCPGLSQSVSGLLFVSTSILSRSLLFPVLRRAH